MAISSSHWDLLRQAVKRLQPTAFAKYFTLQSLLRSTRTSDRKEFQKQFTIHYRLNTGGLTEAFKERYFELLFSCKPCGQTDPYTSLLLELYRFPRRKGDLALQASFVSKLVAIHDESRPIFDIHVSNFFGMSVPKVGNVEFRIAGFVANLEHIKKIYEGWAADPGFQRILRPLCQEQPKLQTSHPSRICDFLVWTIGDQKIT